MRVIAPRYLPTKLPVIPTITTWLLLDRLHVRPMTWGAYFTLLTIVWLAFGIAWWKDDYLPPWKLGENEEDKL
jgi:hypothetical protein